MKNIVSIVFVLFFLTSCGEMALKSTYPGTVTPQMQADFHQAEAFYQSKNYDKALLAYETYIQNHDYTQLTDESIYKQGKIFFVKNQFANSEAKFLELGKKTPSSDYKAKAYHMAGYAAFKQDHFDSAVTSLEKVKAESLPAKLRIQFFSLCMEAAKSLPQETDFGSIALLNLYNLYEDSGDVSIRTTRGPDVIPYSRIQNLIDTWLNTPIASSDIKPWMKNFPVSPAKLYVDFKIGITYYSEKKTDKARLAFSEFLNRYPRSALATQAQKMIDELGGPLATPSLEKADYKLGVLITQTESGNALLNGVRCAVGDGNTCGPSLGAQLIVQDTGLLTETLKMAIANLKKQGVSAIVAIPSKEMAVDAVVAASENKIPIFIVSQKEGLMNQSSYVFQMAMQPKQQIAALVDAAMGQGHKRFGIFYPSISYGQTMAELFAEEVRSQGGQIIVNVEYNRESVDVYSQTRRLKDAVSVTAGIDALFIPDSFKVVNDIIPALEYSGIKGMSLLGTNAWNDPALSLSIADQYPGSFFVDFYDTNSSAKNALEFKDRFSSTFGRAPRVLEAYGFDAAMMVHNAVLSGGKNNVKDAVRSSGGYAGVTGIRGFSDDGNAIIDPTVMKIKSTGIGE